LEHFNLHIQHGQTIALVGETGSGKSTRQPRLRFYEPTEGKILIDGADYRTRSQLWLQSNLGYVLQSPHLFSGTVADNIRYGRPDATDEEVAEAARMVGAEPFIRNMKDGYQADVGEGGNRLSTGQKQLISFARAILTNPSIFVLDEATSSVDTETEQLIQHTDSEGAGGADELHHCASTLYDSLGGSDSGDSEWQDYGRWDASAADCETGVLLSAVYESVPGGTGAGDFGWGDGARLKAA